MTSKTTPTSKFTLMGLAFATVLLTLWLATLPPYVARAFQSESLPPTDTPIPTDTPVFTPTPVPTDTPFPPTDTPIPPTDTPVPTDIPFPTDTPIPTDTPLPASTPIPPTDTPIPPATPFIPTPTPIPPAAPLPPTPTPLPAAGPTSPLPSPQPPAPTPGVGPTDQPLPAVTTTPTIILPALSPTDSALNTDAPVDNTENLIKLIDTLVLYSAYFFLGCGLIVFALIVFGLFYLHRRAASLAKADDTQQPPFP